jgi:hypothetical protein
MQIKKLKGKSRARDESGEFYGFMFVLLDDISIICMTNSGMVVYLIAEERRVRSFDELNEVLHLKPAAVWGEARH